MHMYTNSHLLLSNKTVGEVLVTMIVACLQGPYSQTKWSINLNNTFNELIIWIFNPLVVSRMQ